MSEAKTDKQSDFSSEKSVLKWKDFLYIYIYFFFARFLTEQIIWRSHKEISVESFPGTRILGLVSSNAQQCQWTEEGEKVS